MPAPNTVFITKVKMRSTNPIKIDIINETTMVTMVEPIISSLVGQVTFRSSALTSFRNVTNFSNLPIPTNEYRPGGTRTHSIRFWRPALYQLELLAYFLLPLPGFLMHSMFD